MIALKALVCSLVALVAPWVALYYGAWQQDVPVAALVLSVGAYCYAEAIQATTRSSR